jgi:hypothetical protein
LPTSLEAQKRFQQKALRQDERGIVPDDDAVDSLTLVLENSAAFSSHRKFAGFSHFGVGEQSLPTPNFVESLIAKVAAHSRDPRRFEIGNKAPPETLTAPTESY